MSTIAQQPPLPPQPSFNRREIPSGAHYHPDDLLDQIPPHRHSITAFHTHHQPTSSTTTFRTVNPSLISLLGVPNSTMPEPDWTTLVSYYLPLAHGLANLQDLYILLTRAVLPNAVIENRRLLLYLHTDLVDTMYIPASLPLRWDTCPKIPLYISPAAEDRHDLDTIAPRPIFVAPMRTPDGNRFLTWLRERIHGPHASRYPMQMDYTWCELEGWFDEDEREVRRMSGGVLVRRAVQVLEVWWWVVGANAKLRMLREERWIGVEREF
ncbi:hypothetical protein P3342_000376 [Pyrenophora teres f. teres]|nr:hypothetical protein PTNB29_04983 [Pyrenophora teres f. teres]KAE8869339.1 hypothetical protein PTNB73_04392 [Pyrenophora teres f. teres]KAK1917662.1 hypothetical protein P3342_000376 [Pyrenophora teres f. teres]CAE6996413.1 hypothetical protein PTTW11_00338 [Pyrenophora teres f. teres]